MKLITRSFSSPIRRSREARDCGPDHGPDGYALMVMLIAVSVMSIALLTVLPSTYQEARREREEELLFRGNQYAQAIYLFQKKFNRYPNSVKELLHTDNMSFLRKPWPDPMTPGGKWRFIHASGAGAMLDSWTQGPAPGASPLGQNGQNGQNGMTGTNPQNGSSSGFGSGQSGSSGFGSSSSTSSGFGGSSTANSASGSFSLGSGTSSAAGSASQNDFGWPPSSAGSSQSGDTGQQGASWDATATSGLPPGTDLSGTPTPGLTTPGAADSINSLSPAALHAEEPGRPLDSSGKPKMSPDCIGGNQQGNSSATSSASSTTSAGSSSQSSSSSFSSFTSSSSSSSFGSPGSTGSSGISGSSGFSSSSQSSSSFGSTGSSGGPVGVAIVGVASCSDQASLRTYNKHHRYSEWEFIGVGFNPLGSGAAGLPQGTGQPGQPGQGQQGQGSSSGFGSSGTTNQPGSPGTSGYGPNSPQQPPTTPQPTPTPPSDQPQGP